MTDKTQWGKTTEPETVFEPPSEPETLVVPPPDVVEEHEDPSPPNRLRRTLFVFISCFMAYVAAMYLTLYGSGKIAEMVADGMTSYMLIVAVTYISAHSLDRSGLTDMLKRRYAP